MGRCWGWAFWLFLLIAGGGGALAAELTTLNSGKTIEILGAGRIFSPNGTALMLKYETKVPLSDLAALRKEADEVWDRFVVNVEQGGFRAAIISANTPKRGFIVTTNESFNFVFEKIDGEWRTKAAKTNEPVRLDEAMVRQFIDRRDWAYRHNNMNALRLLMAKDWFLYFVDESQQAGGRKTIKRDQYVTTTHQIFSGAVDRSYRREILDISIDQQAGTARVESREFQVATLNGLTIDVIGRLTEFLELRDGVMLWTKVLAVQEKRTETSTN